MRTFKCPKCGDVQRALAVQVWHRCKKAGGKNVEYKQIEDDGQRRRTATPRTLP